MLSKTKESQSETITITSPVVTDKITVKRSSPYGIPWAGEKENRPKDYFDSIVTEISFTENEKDIYVRVSGKGREEDITVTIDGKPLGDFSGKEVILSMKEDPLSDDRPTAKIVCITSKEWTI